MSAFASATIVDFEPVSWVHHPYQCCCVWWCIRLLCEASVVMWASLWLLPVVWLCWMSENQAQGKNVDGLWWGNLWMSIGRRASHVVGPTCKFSSFTNWVTLTHYPEGWMLLRPTADVFAWERIYSCQSFSFYGFLQLIAGLRKRRKENVLEMIQNVSRGVVSPALSLVASIPDFVIFLLTEIEPHSMESRKKDCLNDVAIRSQIFGADDYFRTLLTFILLKVGFH